MTERRPVEGAFRLDIVRADESHADSLAEFIRQVWDSHATPGSVVQARRAAARRNVAEPGIPLPTWIALQSGRCLGHVTTIPVRFWDGQTERPAYLIKGLMVLPEFRSGPIGYLVLKAAAAQLPRSAALAVAAPARRLFEALGYKDLGPVPNWIRPLAPRQLLNRVDFGELGPVGLPKWAGKAVRLVRASGLPAAVGWVSGAAMSTVAAAVRLPAMSVDAGPFEPNESRDAIDALWNAARVGFRSAVVRDAEYLLQRYEPSPAGPYEWLAARRQGRLVGLAILRRPSTESDGRLRGIRIATLADALYRPEDPTVGVALLGAAERAARKAGADAILASNSSPRFASMLRRQCYVRLSGTVHFLLRDVGGEAPPLGELLSDWWIFRGDGQADEAL